LCFVSFAIADDRDRVNKADLLLDSLHKNSLTFSTAYLEGYYTNKQLANCNLELLRLSDKTLKNLQGPVKYWVFIFLAGANLGATVAIHEIGHGLRFKSFDVDYTLFQSLSRRNYFVYLCHQSLRFGSEGGATLFNQEKLKKSLSNNSFQNHDIIVRAGGLNNQIYFAEKVADDIYERKQCGVLPWLFYTYCKYHLASYDNRADPENDGNDPTGIIHAFQKKGRDDFKKGTIRNASIGSLFLSATTYSIFTEKPLTLYDFRLPDVFPYITTKGMSYKVVSGYEINKDLKLMFGFEKVFEVEPAIEYNLGVDHTIRLPIPMQYKGIVTFGQGLDFEATFTIPVSPRFSVGLGCEIYSCESLQGQRHASNMLSKSGSELSSGYSSDVFAFVSYRYGI
jgi:hypothetical protein